MVLAAILFFGGLAVLYFYFLFKAIKAGGNILDILDNYLNRDDDDDF